VDAEKVAKFLNAERVIVSGSKFSLFGISRELADEILKLIELMTPERCVGYAVVNGESLVFQRGLETVVAFVDEDKIVGTMRRLSESV